MKKKVKKIYICRCFNISEETIIKALEAGFTDLNDVLDKTGAGRGPCGGSCRAKIMAMIAAFQEKKKANSPPDET